jgi:hypothetical protein
MAVALLALSNLGRRLTEWADRHRWEYLRPIHMEVRETWGR